MTACSIMRHNLSVANCRTSVCVRLLAPCYSTFCQPRLAVTLFYTTTRATPNDICPIEWIDNIDADDVDDDTPALYC